jgi:hypothetical protein
MKPGAHLALPRRSFILGCAVCGSIGQSWAQQQEDEVGCFIAPSSYERLHTYDDAWTPAFANDQWRGARIGKVEPEVTPSPIDGDFITALGEILVGLSAVFGEKPSFEFYDDSADPNAKASSRTLREVPGTKGSVVFGVTMLERFLKGKGGDMAVFAVCAHEFGHIYQYHNGWHSKIKAELPDYCVELQADYLAGFAMAHYSRAFPAARIREVGPAWKSLGSSRFNDPGTHGTSEQRLQAIEAGFAFVSSKPDARVADAAAMGFKHVSRYRT